MLGWSINLFRIFGIQLALHGSFLLLLFYFGYTGWQEGGPSGMVWSLALITLFFVCVVLHELGHSLTARRYGVRVPRILLLPIGGMAEFDRIPRQPSQELLITVAGPAVNFAIVALLLPFVWRGLLRNDVSEYSPMGLIENLWYANLGMGIFNLLPVFPMDGGRIFRALLAIKLPYLRATYWAATVGRTLALAFAAAAAFYLKQPVTCILFLFIFWAGNAEHKYALRRDEQERRWGDLAGQWQPVGAMEAEPMPPLLGRKPD